MKATRMCIGIGAALLGLGAGPGCAPKGARRQTDLMEKTRAVKTSALELRVRVNDLADHMADAIEDTADRIAAETSDRAVRRRALVFKVEGVPAVYAAAHRADPLVAAMDVWALAFQITHYVEDGAGRDAFGPQQPLARKGAQDLLADVDAFVQLMAARPEGLARSRARVDAWTRAHPIDHTFSTRPTAATLMADERFVERDVFAAVGAASETIADLSERISTYAAQTPRQARWQAELLVSDMAGEHDVEGALGDVQSLGTAARRVNDFLADAPGLMGGAGSPMRAMVADERRAVLQAVDGQRLQTLEYVTAERVAALAAVREERFAVLGALRQERIDGLQEVDAIKTRAVDTGLVGLRNLVDYTLPRVAAMLMLLMLWAAALGVVGYRLTLGRRGPAGTTAAKAAAA